MSRKLLRRWLGTWAVGFCLVGALSLLGSLAAQAPADRDTDLMDQARRLDRVAAQQREDALRRTLREVERLTLSNPAQALERLKKALAQVENDTVLPVPRREALVRMLKDRIRVTESELASAGKSPRQGSTSGRRVADPRTGDQEEIRSKLRTIQELRKDGRYEEAAREASDLARRYPNNPAAQAAEHTSAAAGQASDARRFQQDRDRRFAGALRDIDRSATPAKGDMEFPRDWKERTKGRTATVQLTAKERAILKALETPVTVTFKNSRLEDVLEYLRGVSGQEILLDPEALKDVEASYDTPITLKLRNVSLRTVLHKVLGELGMTYVIKDEVLQATSAQRAKEMMVVRSYYIGDLIANLGGLGLVRAPFTLPFAPFFNQQQLQAAQAAQGAQALKAVDQIIDMIQTSVDPSSWRVNGGSGTITFNPSSMSLVIKQSAEVHAMLATGLPK